MRRPAASLVPVPLARLAGYALLATLGSLQWVRYVDGASTVRAIAWAAAGTLTGALTIAARRRPLALAAAVLVGAVLAIAASGLDLTYLRPRHLDDLGAGLDRGLSALNTVRLPYLGKEPWVLTTVQLSGAGICWLAALLATWPTGGRTRAGALTLLLTLAAAPVVSLGASRPVLLGLALAALTAAFLWLERLARRPGLGALVLAAAVLLAAIPLGAAADREEPWFDYKALSAKLAGGVPIAYNWEHEYGPIDWPRDGVELFRVKSDQPHYWKADVLNTFAHDRWDDELRDDHTPDLPRHRRAAWNATFRVAFDRLKSPTVVTAGTTLGVAQSTRPVERGYIPGLWQASQDKFLSKGDSYRVSAYVPDPTPQQLATARVDGEPRRLASLSIDVPIRRDAVADTPSLSAPNGREHPRVARIQFEPYETGAVPIAQAPQLGLQWSGPRALSDSRYARTWRLAERLRRGTTTPYDYVLRVAAYLRKGFAYTETPPPPGAGIAPLESFLLDSKRGYCQQFSGAMALLLRMGGLPARVATGFSPGGLVSSSGEWVVRDTDAHSWVEAWFDGLGWVTFDPTPPATPARSQIASIALAPSTPAAGTKAGDARRQPVRRPEGGVRRPAAAAKAGPNRHGSPLWPLLGAGIALALLAAGLSRALHPPADALTELQRALRRSGREVPSGMTLAQLERRLGTSDYLQALRAARYRPGVPPPGRSERAAFRRALARGGGWTGRLRSYYALPPILRRTRPR